MGLNYETLQLPQPLRRDSSTNLISVYTIFDTYTLVLYRLTEHTIRAL